MKDKGGSYHSAMERGEDSLDVQVAKRAEATSRIPTPAELAAQTTVVDEVAIAAFRQKVTDALRRSWSPDSKRVVIDTRSATARVVRAVEAELKAAGWSTSTGDDQRDGAWLAVEST